MSVIDPSLILPHLSSEEAWNLINALPVSYLDFARHTYYYHRLYDVLTGDNAGVHLDPQGQGSGMVINDCFRQSLWRTLIGVTNEAESWLGYNFSARYHYEETTFPPGGKAQTRWPGVEAMSVKLEWEEIAGYGPFDIDPLCVYDATVDTPGSDPILRAPASYFENPADVIVRDADTNNVVRTLTRTGYPRLDNGDWLIPLDLKHYIQANGVNLQHRKYLFLDIVNPILSAGQSAFPVYPDTNQIIQEAKPPTPIGGGAYRHTFYIYTLVAPSFAWEQVNLLAGEHYKLYSQIEYKARAEVAAHPQVIWTKGGTSQTISTTELEDDEIRVDVTLVPVQSEPGVYHIAFGDEVYCTMEELWCAVTECTQDVPEHCTLRFYYKTNPTHLPQDRSQSLGVGRQAILHKVAADVPVVDCGCRIPIGFIWEAQQRYDEVLMKPYQGFEIRTAKYERTRGRLEYDKLIGSMDTYSRLVML